MQSDRGKVVCPSVGEMGMEHLIPPCEKSTCNPEVDVSVTRVLFGAGEKNGVLETAFRVTKRRVFANPTDLAYLPCCESVTVRLATHCSVAG